MKKNIAKTLIFRPDGCMLLLYRGKTHPKFPGHLDLPGGELDGNESEVEALLREIREETSIIVEKSCLQRTFIRSYPEVEHILYTAQIDELSPNIILSWEHYSYKWFTKSDLLQQPIPKGADRYYLDVVEFLKEFK